VGDMEASFPASVEFFNDRPCKMVDLLHLRFLGARYNCKIYIFWIVLGVFRKIEQDQRDDTN
jgi:hypothetical protein